MCIHKLSSAICHRMFSPRTDLLLTTILRHVATDNVSVDTVMSEWVEFNAPSDTK